MARVTVEDCIDKVENRFDLVLLASHRARMISSGSQITLDRDNDKNPVVSLREIAETTVSPEDLKEDLIHSLQKHVEVDEPEEEGGFGAGGGDLLSELLEAQAGEQAIEDSMGIDGEFEDEPGAEIEEGVEDSGEKEA